MRKAVSLLAGILTGALVGAAVALLLAPYSGETLRDRIANYTQKMQDEVRLAADQRRAEMQVQLAKLREPMPDAKNIQLQ